MSNSTFPAFPRPPARGAAPGAARIGPQGANRRYTVIIDREYGSRLGYRSTWTARSGSGAPLRYRLVTTTDIAKGTASVEFHAAGGLHPADHLTCVGILEAVRPVHESAAGISHRDPSITALRSDDRL